MIKRKNIGIRIERKLRPLVRGIDVDARYPLPYEDPGYLDASRNSSAEDCARAIGNGSLDESSVGIFANSVIGASLAKTRALFGQRAAGNEEILHAMEAAEAKQMTYLKAVRERYAER